MQTGRSAQAAQPPIHGLTGKSPRWCFFAKGGAKLWSSLPEGGSAAALSGWRGAAAGLGPRGWGAKSAWLGVIPWGLPGWGEGEKGSRAARQQARLTGGLGGGWQGAVMT